MRTLIKNGTVITASDTFAADVWIEGGRVVALTHPAGRDRAGVAVEREIDATGKYVIPGGIDVHTHLDMPFGGTTSIDDFESGTVAAAHGGTTAVVDFAIQRKGGTLTEALDAWHAKAEGKATIDYGFHIAATDLSPARLEEMAKVVKEGVTSFKLFMAYPGSLMLDDEGIFRTMLRAGELGALISMHAEVGLAMAPIIERALAEGKTAPIYHALTRPEVAEASATERTIALAELAGVPAYIVHLTCERALARVREARDRGLPIHAETCPQYLFLTEDALRGKPPGEGDGEFDGAKYVCSPPLRPGYHHEHLWRGLRNHDLEVVATDHCPFRQQGQKEMGRGNFAKIPNGMPSIETRLYLLWEAVREGRISMNRFVEITSTAPAKLFGLYPRKGNVSVGADADLVIWDPNRTYDLSQKNMHSRADYSPYEGRTVSGAPTHVFSRGELIVENDRFLGKKGRGHFLRRATFGL